MYDIIVWFGLETLRGRVWKVLYAFKLVLLYWIRKQGRRILLIFVYLFIRRELV